MRFSEPQLDAIVLHRLALVCAIISLVNTSMVLLGDIMANINLRGLEDELMLRLKEMAKAKKTSVNALLLEFVRQGLGIAKKREETIFNELDYLAGTWEKSDADAFKAATKDFDKIDEDLWK